MSSNPFSPRGAFEALENHKLLMTLIHTIVGFIEYLQQRTESLDWAPDLLSTVITVAFWGGLAVVVAVYFHWLWNEKRKVIAVTLAAVYVVAGFSFGYIFYAWLHSPNPGKVAVFPPELWGGQIPHFTQQLGALLTADLDAAGEFSTLPPGEVRLGYSEARRDTWLNTRSAHNHAKQLGAQLYLLGDVERAGDELLATVRLFDSHSKHQVAYAAVPGHRGDVAGLSHRLAARLVTNYLAGAHRAPVFTDTASPPMEDFKSYLRSDDSVHHGNFIGALRDLDAHTAGRYAPALYMRAVARAWAPNNEEQAGELAKKAYDAGTGRGPADTLLLRGLATSLLGYPGDALTAFRAASRDYGSLEAQYGSAETAFYSNPFVGEGIDVARAGFERVVQLDPQHYRALFHLLVFALRDGNTVAARRYAEAARNLHPDTVQATALDVTLALLRGDTADARRRLERAVAEPENALPLTLRLATERWRGSPGDALARSSFELVSDAMIASGDRQLLLVGLDARVRWELAQGRWRTAERFIRQIPPTSSTRYTLLGLLAGGFGDRIPMDEVEAARVEVAGWRPPELPSRPSLYDAARPIGRQYVLGMISARLRDDDAAERHAGMVAAMGDGGGRDDFPWRTALLAGELADGIRGCVQLSRGQPRSALAFLGRVTRVPTRMLQGHTLYAHELERYLTAEANYQLGNDAEALRWFASLTDSPTPSVFVTEAHLRQAQIYERLGQSELAASHRRLFAGMAGRQERPFHWGRERDRATEIRV